MLNQVLIEHSTRDLRREFSQKVSLHIQSVHRTHQERKFMHTLMFLFVALSFWIYASLISAHLGSENVFIRRTRYWFIRRLLKMELNWNLRIVRSQEFKDWCQFKTGDENTAILVEGAILSFGEGIDPFPILDEIKSRFGIDSYESMLRILPLRPLV